MFADLEEGSRDDEIGPPIGERPPRRGCSLSHRLTGADCRNSSFRKRPPLRSTSSSWMAKATQTAKVRGPDATERSDALGTQGAGAVAEAQAMTLKGQMTILERAERAYASLDARDRAGMATRSSRRVTAPPTDWSNGGSPR